jgi:hypothetical protein
VAGVSDHRVGEVWQLRHGELLLAEITISRVGAGEYLHGSFDDKGSFAEFAPLLTEERYLFEGMAAHPYDETIAAVKTHHDQVLATMTLVSPEGPVADFLMQVIGDFTTFRWSGTPIVH